MAYEARLARKVDPREQERDPVREAVRIDAEARSDDLVAPLKQADRWDVAPFGVGRGEELADVALARRPEDRVDQRVRDHVAVRMAYEARLARKVDPREHERDPVREAVRIDAEA